MKSVVRNYCMVGFCPIVLQCFDMFQVVDGLRSAQEENIVEINFKNNPPQEGCRRYNPAETRKIFGLFETQHTTREECPPKMTARSIYYKYGLPSNFGEYKHLKEFDRNAVAEGGEPWLEEKRVRTVFVFRYYLRFGASDNRWRLGDFFKHHSIVACEKDKDGEGGFHNCAELWFGQRGGDNLGNVFVNSNPFNWLGRGRPIKVYKFFEDVEMSDDRWIELFFDRPAFAAEPGDLINGIDEDNDTYYENNYKSFKAALDNLGEAPKPAKLYKLFKRNCNSYVSNVIATLAHREFGTDAKKREALITEINRLVGVGGGKVAPDSTLAEFDDADLYPMMRAYLRARPSTKREARAKKRESETRGGRGQSDTSGT